MESLILVYEGYSLYEAPRGYLSCIDGQTLRFDTAGQWKKYIDYKNEREKSGNRNLRKNGRAKRV